MPFRTSTPRPNRQQSPGSARVRGPGLKTAVRIDGLENVMAMLAGLRLSTQRKYMRTAVTKAARVVAKAARQFAAKETGALRKSLWYRVYTSKDKTRVGAVVGARRAEKREKVFSRKTGHRTWSKYKTKFGESLKGAQIGRDPANYAHLIEYGHKIVIGGTTSRNGGGAAGVSRRGRLAAWAQYKGRTSFQRKMRKWGVTFARFIGIRGAGKVVGVVKARPFMRPAYEATRAQVNAILKRELEAGVQKELEKRARKRGSAA